MTYALAVLVALLVTRVIASNVGTCRYPGGPYGRLTCVRRKGHWGKHTAGGYTSWE